MPIDLSALKQRIAFFQSQRLLSEVESGQLQTLFTDRFSFYPALQQADSLHVHIKVDDVEQLPQEDILAQGGVIENAKPGYIKYAFADGVHFIFSSIPVSQDDLMQLPQPARPFVDHFGIDLRQESVDVQSVFDSIPEEAKKLGWQTVPQGGLDKPVFCCHVQVKAKHWVYPPESFGLPPIEFAYGPLTISGTQSGCDLRPADPARLQVYSPKQTSCSSTASCSGT